MARYLWSHYYGLDEEDGEFWRWGQKIILQGYFIRDKHHSPALEGIIQGASMEPTMWFDSNPHLTPVPANPNLPAVLDQHVSLFQSRKGLLLNRNHDHVITLLPKSKLVSVHPYWYAYYHKDKIEHLVQELLLESVIYLISKNSIKF